jgi:BirA family transcriptional regulator, biotin operon repressor / biotin---[acetyl-CoA-carboxylase] ligase
VRLHPEAEADGYRLLCLEGTGSTNDDAFRAAREGDPGRLWITAAEQHKGRGRHARSWSSPPGNLYASLLLLEPCSQAVAPQLGFVAGLALHEAAAEAIAAQAPRLALKWPNDLLLDGRKASGLLLEGQQIAQTFTLVIGFGVNIGQAPTGTPYATAALREAVPGLTREVLFAALSRSFARRLGQWRQGRGFAAIRQEWLDRAAGLGSEVSLRLSSGERRGIFTGLDSHGRLQLETAQGQELIDAGDLYFPRNHAMTAEPASGARSSTT